MLGLAIEREGFDEDGHKQYVLDIPSRRVLALLLDEHKIKNELSNLEHALHHVGNCKGEARTKRGTSDPCDGCKESWYETYVSLMEATSVKDLDFTFSFPLLMDYGKSFHTLTPITCVTFTTRLIERLEASKCTLDLTRIQTSATDRTIDATKLTGGAEGNAFVHCNCPAYLHYSWCDHACLHARCVSKILARIPQQFDPKRLATKRKGRIANAKAGGALGYF